MPVLPGLERTFDSIAQAYDRWRPGYGDAAYQAIFAYCPVSAQSNVVEIGIGSGQATRPFLQKGCHVTAVEPGEQFAALCRAKFQEYPAFLIRTGKLEETDFPDGTVDLVFSATAFHWIAQEIGYPKVFSMLKSGGAFVRMDNHPFEDKGRTKLADEIQALYRVYMGSTARPVEYGDAMAKAKAEIAARYGFTDIRYQLLKRTRQFSAREYTALLGTYSDHIAIEETKRKEFFEKIEQAIDRHGGRYTVYDTIELQLARKP